MLDFKKLEILTAGPVRKSNMHHRHQAKFSADRWNRRGVMAVFQFLRWRRPPSWIFFKVENFDCWICSQGQYATTCQILCWLHEPLRYMTVFRFFKMTAVCHLGFWKVEILLPIRFGGPICVTKPNFVPIDRTVAETRPFFSFLRWRRPPSWIFNSSKFYVPVRWGMPICISMPNFVPICRTFAEIWLIFGFPRWRPSAILDLFYVYLDHTQRAFVGLCHCAKFVWSRCSS